MRLRLLSSPSRWGPVRRTISIWIVLFLALGPSAFATSYYVSNATGNDTNDGLTPATAWKTLTHALGVAGTPNPALTSGDVINVAAGTYSFADESFPLTLVNGVAVLGPAADPTHGVMPTAIISGNGTVPLFHTSGSDLSNLTRLSSFQLNNFDATSGFGSDLIDFDINGNFVMSPQIDNNQMVGFGQADGVGTRGSDPTGQFNATITNNTFDNLSNAIDLVGSFASGGATTLSPTISGNTFTSNNAGVNLHATEVGVLAGTAAYSPIITGNTFTGGSKAIDIYISLSPIVSATLNVAPTISGNTFSGMSEAVSISISGSSITAGTLNVSPNISDTNGANRFSGVSGNAIYMKLYHPVSNGNLTFAPSIMNNPIGDNTPGSIGGNGISISLLLAAVNGTGQATLSPTITGNGLSNVSGFGIDMSLSALATTNAQVTMHPTVSGNSLSNIGAGGIFVGNNIQAHNNAQVTISPQVISNPTISGIGGAGISVSASINASDSAQVTFNPNISTNVVSGARDGIDVFWEMHGTAVGTTLISNGTVNGNQVNGTNLSSGIFFQYSATNWKLINNANWTVDNNIVGRAQGTGIVATGNLANNQGGNYRLSVSGNNVFSGNSRGLEVHLAEAGAGSIGQTIIIDGNTVTGNASTGLSVFANGVNALLSNDIQITNNNITGNGAAASGDFTGSPGLYIDVDGVPTNPVLVSCNTVTSSRGKGVQIGSSFATSPPPDFGGGNRSSLGNNRIFNNAGYDFYNNYPAANGVVAARHNWWGTTDGPTIDSHIYDDEESGGVKGAVDFSNFKPADSGCVNNPPVANNDSYPTSENNTLVVPAPGVLANDTDADLDPLTAALVSGPLHGALTFNSDGSFSYTPTAFFYGTDSFTYQASDGMTPSNVATVTITIAKVDNAPVANNDSYSTPEDTQLIVSKPGVLANDTDPEGDPLTAALVGGPSHGTVALNSDGSFTYTPNALYFGPDSFTYQASDGSLSSNVATVNITITHVNHAPVANNDSYSTPEDTQLIVSAPGVLANDTDVDGDPLTAALVGGPAHGTLTLNSDGSFTYTPNALYFGSDSFTYQASDGSLSSNVATVTITITHVNHAPVANNDSYSTPEDTQLIVSAPGVLANDTDVDGDPLTAALVGGPSNGTLTLNSNGSFTYTPNALYSGSDSFTYQASDGSLSSNVAAVSITVTHVNHAPVANNDSYSTPEDTQLIVSAPGVLANDTDVDGDSLTAALVSGPSHGTLTLNSNGSFTYTPNALYFGADSFTYQASDGSLSSNVATVSITVTHVNHAPVANNDSYSTPEDTQLIVSAPGVLANDTDVDGDPLTAALVSPPSHGTLTLNSNGSFTYTPNALYFGADSFTYQASDGSLSSNVATVSITVVHVNHAPVANNDVASTNAGTPVTTNVIANDTDVDGDPLTIVASTNGAHGTVSCTTPNCTYTPAPGFSGSDTYTYSIADPSNAQSTATVAVSVLTTNKPPVANDDSASTTPGTPVTLNVLSNDSDPDGDTLSVIDRTQGSHGSVDCTGSGDCTYTPVPGFIGTDSFTYTISDGRGGTASATVTVTVAKPIADLAIAMSASPGTVTPGGAIAYTINVNNAGPGTAGSVSVTQTLPAGVAFNSATGSGWTCSAAGAVVSCTLAALAPGAAPSLTINATAPATGGTLTSTAQVSSSDSTDPNGANNSASASNTIDTSCSFGAPSLIAPTQGATGVPNPVTFKWTSVAQAVGYDLFLSIEGGAVQKVGSTDGATSTSLSFTLPNVAITWYVQARFAGCPPAQSQTSGFTVEQPDTCALHTSAALISPLGGAVPSSVIDFQWNTVLHVSGYRVWASVEGLPFAALGTTEETKFRAIIPFGKVEWFVESLFPGCPSTESLHASFTVPAATSCNNPAATPTAPGNGTTVNNQSIDFTWTAATGAIGYEVYIALNSGSPALIGSTDPGVTTLHQDVAPGSLDWFVRALFNGCLGVDSTHFQFVFAPPPSCPTQRPVLTAPAENAIGLNSPVSFEWGAVPGATFKLHYSLNHGDVVTLSTTATHVDNVSIDPGEVIWSVEAVAAGCPSLGSPDSTFTVVPPPLPCSTPDTTDIRAEANASSGNNYTVRWNPIPGAVLYDLQESLSPTFIPATQLSVTTTEQSFSHTNTASTDPVYYFYRVRGVNNCNATHGLFSDPISVGILPPQQTATFNTTGATPVENPQSTTYQLHICSSAGANCSFVGGVGQTFTATVDQPWLTVSPASGVVTAAAITLTVTANPATLPVGTNTAAVTVSFSGGPSAQGGKSPHGNTTSSSSNISVNLVAPTTSKPKDTPPPDALIVPAVAHSDGVSSHFDTDVRVSNTSPQPMKYQLTFTPSGDSGIKDGKQTTIDIDPGRTVALDDVLQSWFGTGANSQGATGALEIRPLTTSTTSVSSSAVSGLPNIVTFATSRTYSLLGNGSLGTIVPAIPYANFIGKSTSTSNPSVLSLQQIAQTSAFRTNLGLVEGSGQAATVLVSVFGSSGNKLTEFSQNLTGGQHLQLNSVLATQNLNNVTDGRIEVKVTSATGKVTAYASVLDDKSNDAQLVSPVSLSLAGSAKFVLPGVSDLTNDQGKTQTDARLFNASSSAVTATLSLHVDGSPNNVLSKDVTIAAGEVKVLDNVFQTLFGASNVGNAALHITTAAPTNLIATAKTYNQIGSGTVAQFISAVTSTNTIALGNRPLQLLQVEESNRFSTDVGVAEVSGKPVDLEITIIPPDAKVTARTVVSLGANEFHNMHQLLSSIGLDGTYNARVTVRVVGGDGHATAYASVTDKTTHDPTFVAAQ